MSERVGQKVEKIYCRIVCSKTDLTEMAVQPTSGISTSLTKSTTSNKGFFEIPVAQESEERKDRISGHHDNPLMDEISHVQKETVRQEKETCDHYDHHLMNETGPVQQVTVERNNYNTNLYDNSLINDTDPLQKETKRQENDSCNLYDNPVINGTDPVQKVTKGQEKNTSTNHVNPLIKETDPAIKDTGGKENDTSGHYKNHLMNKTVHLLQETEIQKNYMSEHYNQLINETGPCLGEKEEKDNSVPKQTKPWPKETEKQERRISVKRNRCGEDNLESVEKNSRDVHESFVSKKLYLSDTNLKRRKVSGNYARLTKRTYSPNSQRSLSDTKIHYNTNDNKPVVSTAQKNTMKTTINAAGSLLTGSVSETHKSSSYFSACRESVQGLDPFCGPSTSKKARLEIPCSKVIDCSRVRPLNNEPLTSVSQDSDSSSDGSDLGNVEVSNDCDSNLSANSLSRNAPDDLAGQNISLDSKSQGESSSCLKQCFTNIKLEKWLSYSEKDLADKMLNGRCYLHDLVNDPNISKTTTYQLVKIIAKASHAASGRENVANIFSLTLTDSFLDHLQKLQISFLKSIQNDLAEFYENLFTVLTSYFKVMPNLAIDRSSDLLQMILLVLPKLNGLHDTHIMFSNFVESIQELKFIKKEPVKQRIQRDRLACLDLVEPMEDFRTISVEPTTHDINASEKPFVRRNILKGKFKDVDTYLDIQFRLLREDFIRPLRDGIAHFKNNVYTKNRFVRIYKDVKVLYSNIIDGNMTHFIKIFLPRNFRLESSKRMLYGNLLCLSADKFKTCVFATVSCKNNRELKEGILGITPLPNSKVDHSALYTVAESRTFFVAYRYVLSSLQQMSISDFPFQEYLVQVSSDVEPPNYLGNRPDICYDLRLVLMPSIPPDQCSPALKEIGMSVPLTDWPHHDDFGLDESQLKALYCALTKRLAIIQGPPGTGKTHLGLKICQVLLHNSQAWSKPTDDAAASDEEDGYDILYRRINGNDEDHKKKPILVVCYTNHALDQFLEGMQSYTKKIVRIGGRSQSTEIQSYQINKQVSKMIVQRRVPNNIFYSMKDLSRNEDYIKKEYNYLQTFLKKIEEGVGLIGLTTFNEYGIIPVDTLDQFSGMPSDNHLPGSNYQTWILPNDFNPPANDASCEDEQDDINKGDEDEESQWQGDRGKEEKNRIRFNERAESKAFSETKCKMCFELTLEQCYINLKLLKKEKSKAKRALRHSLAKRLVNEERRINCLRYVVSFDWKPYELEDGEDIHSLAFNDRCRLYASWCDQLSKKIRLILRHREIQYRKLTSSMDELRTTRQLHVARRADVVGLTTTGAAQHQALLQQLGPSIVIVEEAAEILEAHVLAALSTSCQHLIMIGDHQQLKPSTAVFELAKKYGLETSMFERLINNGIAYETLQYQHRMRPEISRLLVPSVYPALLDAPVVHNALPVRGLDANVFFVAHNHAEMQDTDDDGSHSNLHEATFLAQLARYLVLQGYSQSQITVLTPYSGQFFLLRKELRRFSVCEGIRVSIVDNFQGEESDIVLLSLVRSNETGDVGFLKCENRVCVALSRAKIGLYMIGNLEQLSRESSLWKTIRATLESTDAAAEALLLCCQNHPLEKAAVTSAEDFLYLSPDGGCRKMCFATLPRCGHQCPRVCHAENMDHKQDRCVMTCNKKCDNDHSCPIKCWQPCLPCEVPVEKTLLCGHDVQTTCGATNIKCRVQVEKIIPTCKHAVLVPCHFDPRGEKCEQLCKTRLDCGHPCRLKCHADMDPEHLEYLCTAPCTRPFKDCSRNHVCKKMCYLQCDPCPYLLTTKRKCGHSLRVKCSASKKEVGACAVLVTKTLLQCGHEIQANCGADPDPSLCLDVCVRLLPCGHPCGQLCGQPCATQCSHLVLTDHKCPQGHAVSLPCYLSQKPTDDDIQRFCTTPCGVLLQCQHACGGTCNSCMQGRLHLSCALPCTRTLICGHVCQASCSKACPPCQKPCPWRCPHSQCRLSCGQLCSPCQETCRTSCSHKINCGQKCGEACRCEPCQRPCPKKLSCGHPCVGFCGDPCPPKCRICDKSVLSEILFGAEDEPDARFVLLPDCGHMIESEGLTKWLESPGDGSLQMKRCPLCQQPIYNLKRFKNLILQTFKDVSFVIGLRRAFPSASLVEIHRRVTGLHLLNVKKSAWKDSALVSAVKKYVKLKSLAANCSDVDVKRSFTVKLLKMESGVDYGDQQLGLFFFQTKVLERVATTRPTLDGALQDLLELVLTRVMKEENNAPLQLQQEVGQELQRIVFLSSFSSQKPRLQQHSATSTLLPQIDKLCSPATVFTPSVEQKAVALLQQCREKVGGLWVTNTERLQIVKAMGLSQGHWYKCPQGHIYCIGNCGGAMQTSQCPECKQTVGGMNHRLAEGNQHAPEMDGSAQAAWPPH